MDPKSGRLIRRTYVPAARPAPNSAKAAQSSRAIAPKPPVLTTAPVLTQSVGPAPAPPARTATAAPLTASVSTPVATRKSPASDDLKRMIEEVAQTHNVDPLLVHSLIRVESNYNPIAVSPKGAEGLMQLIPSTAHRFGAVNSFDSRQNLEAGVKYLKHLQQMFGDNRLALAAYNAGEGAVMKYGDIPPYRETQHYVDLVTKLYGSALKTSAPAQTAQTVEPKEPPPNPVFGYVDSEGRIHLETQPGPSATP